MKKISLFIRTILKLKNRVSPYFLFSNVLSFSVVRALPLVVLAHVLLLEEGDSEGEFRDGGSHFRVRHHKRVFIRIQAR